MAEQFTAKKNLQDPASLRTPLELIGEIACNESSAADTQGNTVSKLATRMLYGRQADEGCRIVKRSSNLCAAVNMIRCERRRC